MSQDGEKSNVSKRIGEFIVLGLFLFADVWGFWNYSHALCLTLAILAIVGLLLYDGAVDIRSRRTSILTAVLIVMAVAINYFAPVIPSPSPVESDSHGWLIAANEPTPPNGCSTHFGGHLPPDTLLTLIGDNGVLSHPGQTGIAVLTVGSCASVSLNKTTEGVAVNADDYNAEGKLLFRIENNEFHLVENKIGFAKRSTDRSTLTVTGDDGRELLMVKYINPTTVRVRGVFACKGHDPIAIKDDETVPGSEFSESCFDGGGFAVQYPN